MAMIVPQYERKQTEQVRQPVGVAAPQSGIGNVAQGLADVGQMFDQWQSDIDEADAKRADTDYSDLVRKTLYEDGTGYLYAQGGDALARRKQAAETLQKAFDERLAGLSPSARAMAQSSMESRRQSALTSVDRHAGGERVGYLNSQADARINSAIQDGIIDPAAMSRSLSIARNEIAEAGARNGWSPEVVAQKTQEAEGTIHSGVVTRLANVDPQQALDYLNAHRDVMQANDVVRLEGALVPEAKRARGRQIGQAAFATGQVDEASVIRHFEGFKETPYYDVNALRAGYGSDTVTRQDGSVERVGSGTRVSREDAERDLMRRINTEFKPAAAAALGEVWENLTPGQQAVMVSLTYNYGAGAWNKGLARVAQAARTGGTSEIAHAIRALGSHNGGQNARRRSEEAAIFMASEGQAPARPSQADVLNRMVDIQDPIERAAAFEEYRLRAGIAEQQQAQQRGMAQQAGFALIETGGDIDRLTLDQKMAIGQEGMSSLRTYQSKVMAGEPIATDPELFVELARQSSTDPAGFAARDPLEWRNRLSDADFKSFVQKQVEAATGAAGGNPLTVSTINTVAKEILPGAGIDPKKKSGAKSMAQLQEGLLRWSQSYQSQNNRAPSHLEIREQANAMLLPIIIDPPGLMNRESGKMFEMDFEAMDLEPADILDGTLKIDGTTVPTEQIEAFVREFEAALGRAPTPQEVIEGLAWGATR